MQEEDGADSWDCGMNVVTSDLGKRPWQCFLFKVLSGHSRYSEYLRTLAVMPIFLTVTL